MCGKTYATKLVPRISEYKEIFTIAVYKGCIFSLGRVACFPIVQCFCLQPTPSSSNPPDSRAFNG